MKPTFKFELTHPNAKLPTKVNPNDSGWDVYSCEDTVLTPGKPVICKTGLRCVLPPGYELQVRSRSGLAAKSGVFVLNSPGTVDSDYRGLIGVILTSVSDAPYIVKAGDRIAQLVPAKVEDVDFVQVESIDTNTERGSGGFGSSGK